MPHHQVQITEETERITVAGKQKLHIYRSDRIQHQLRFGKKSRLIMNNQVLLWMNPEKQGVLKKRGGKRKNWKMRQFLVKDTFLFYFKMATAAEQLSPSGVVPLQGSKVDLSPQEGHETEGDEPAPTYVFVIFLPDKLLADGIVKRNTYFLGGENLTDCYLWMRQETAEAIRHASTSRRIVKGQLHHARLELMELEARWNVCKAIDAGKLPPMKAMFDENAEEDPLVLQALSDDLMILYRLVEIAVKGLTDERTKKVTAEHHFAMIQHLKDLQLMELSKQGKRVQAEEDYKKCHAQLNSLIKMRLDLRATSDKLEMFEGQVVGGTGLPSMSQVESMLLTTIEQLDKLEDVSPGTEQMPKEDRLVELQLAMVPVQEEYVELLENATAGEKKHEAIMLADAADDSSEEEDDVVDTEEEATFRSSILTGGFS